jgi:hypothetical protein
MPSVFSFYHDSVIDFGIMLRVILIFLASAVVLDYFPDRAGWGILPLI